MSYCRRHSALLALTAAGLLWGLTVPLSKLALDWLDGGWLTVARFALAAPLLAFTGRRHLRAAMTPKIVFAGAVGYGLVIVLQNAGIERTSVSHAALIVGAVPALVALVAAASGRGSTGPAAWLGFALALSGVGIVAGGGGGTSSLDGDALVLISVSLSATFVVLQPSLLRGRDPIAVTAVQMVAGGLAAIPNAALEGLPSAPAGAGPVLALVALATAGTLVPFALFAYGQSRVAPELAGAFLNLEPLVGTAAGALAFGDPFGGTQLAGGLVILAGIALSTTPRRAAPRTQPGGSPTPRRQPASVDWQAVGGRVRSCPQASIRSTSRTPPRPTASAARAADRRAPDDRSRHPPPHRRPPRVRRPGRPRDRSWSLHRYGLPHLETPVTSLTPRVRQWNLCIKQTASPSLPNMTLLAPRSGRTLTPHTYVVPVVRELPSSHPAAGVLSSSAAW